jgi:hypothetical protein
LREREKEREREREKDEEREMEKKIETENQKGGGDEKKETRGNTKCGHEVRVKRPTKLSKGNGGRKRFVTRLYDGMLKVCVCVMGGEKKRKSFHRDLTLFGRTQ